MEFISSGRGGGYGAIIVELRYTLAIPCVGTREDPHPARESKLINSGYGQGVWNLTKIYIDFVKFLLINKGAVDVTYS